MIIERGSFVTDVIGSGGFDGFLQMADFGSPRCSFLSPYEHDFFKQSTPSRTLSYAPVSFLYSSSRVEIDFAFMWFL